jgi:hypothetical protein
MTQTLYAHINKRKDKLKKIKVMETFLGHVQATDESFRGTGFHYTVFDFWHFFFPLHPLSINHSYLKSLAL